MAHPSARSEARSQRLSYIFFLFFSLANEKLWPPDAEGRTHTPRFRAAANSGGIPQFWASETAPPEFAEVWGADWHAVREAWLSNPDFLKSAGHAEISGFDWTASDALKRVRAADEAADWARILDPLVGLSDFTPITLIHVFQLEGELTKLGRTVRNVWESPDFSADRNGGIPKVDAWDSVANTVHAAVYFCGAPPMVFPRCIRMFWAYWLGRQIDRESHRFKRASQKIAKLQDQLANLGIDPVACTKIVRITPATVRVAVHLLGEYVSELDRHKLTDADRKSLDTEVPPNQFHLWYRELNTTTQAHEFYGRALGWVTAQFAPEIPATVVRDPACQAACESSVLISE